MLFENLRFFAYSIVNHEREHGSYEHFMQRLTAHAHNSNQFRSRGSFLDDLPMSSIRSTVRSVGRWTWSRYTGNSRCHRGVMELDKSTPLAERQKLSAKRTHAVRHQATESKIRAACRALRHQDKPLAIASIAALSGITRQTVAKYRHVINETRSNVVVALQPIPTSPNPAAKNTPGCRSQENTELCVKHGANQIPAGGVWTPKGETAPTTPVLIDTLIDAADSS